MAPAAIPSAVIPSVIPGVIPAVPARKIPRAVPAAIPSAVIPGIVTPVPGVPEPGVAGGPATVPATVMPGAAPAPAGAVPGVPIPGPVSPSPVNAEGGVGVGAVDEGDGSRVGILVKVDPRAHMLGDEQGVGYAVLEIDVGTSSPGRQSGGFLVEDVDVGLRRSRRRVDFGVRSIVDSVLIPLPGGIIRVLRR